MPPSKQHNRPRAWIPQEDIMGLKTLVHEKKWNQEEIAKYYRFMGLEVSQATVSRRIKEMRDKDVPNR